jgi:pimeloyl-ACP methyl ester carboxylesterase
VVSRRTFTAGVTAGVVSAMGGPLSSAAGATRDTTKVRPGLESMPQAPHLPTGFTDTFTSRYIYAGGLRQHAVIGGDGPPLLLLHGWPETWFAWRLLMPALARNFEVIAVDQRGVGHSGKPRDGYDTGTLARDLVALMDALGHQRFAMVGHDVGMVTAYALAADHPDRLDRLAVAEAILFGVTPSPPLIGTTPANNRLWHIAFNRLAEVNEELVKGREHIYFGWQFATKAVNKLPDYAVRYYIHTLASVPGALRGSFGFYRELDTTIAQNQQRQTRRLTLPVLAIGGANSGGEGVANTMRLVADDVQSLVIPGCGHWVPEEAPEEMLAALMAFLAPYRAGSVAAHKRHTAKA